MSVTYVDVSQHDWSRRGGQLDWARVKAATSSVMCARATYGDPRGFNPSSPYFVEMVAGAKRAGIDVCGGYHNLIKGDQASINRQVDYLRSTLDRAGAVWAMLDVERYEELVSNGLWPRFDDVQQFCDRWRAVDGRTLTVYLPHWIWSGHLGRPDLRPLRAPLVASNYGSNPNGTPAQVYAARGGDRGAGWAAYGNVTPTIWQYGSNVDCPGASGQTDCNAYKGSLEQLRALLTGGTDEMDLKDPIHLVTGQGVTYAKPTTTVEGVLASTNFYVLQTRNRVAAVAEQLVALGTVVGQIKGVDGAALMAQLQEIEQAVGEVDDDVLAALGRSAEQDPAETARLLKAALGDQLPAVLAELQRAA